MKNEQVAAYILIASGIFLIFFAAYLAYSDYKTYAPSVIGSNVNDVLSSVISSLLVLAMKLGYLGILVWGGSLVTKYGIQLLLGVRREIPRQ
ncbi:MAG: hypothetical protein QW039_03190 [Fervidicoccaceae archaeon]